MDKHNQDAESRLGWRLGVMKMNVCGVWGTPQLASNARDVVWVTHVWRCEGDGCHEVFNAAISENRQHLLVRLKHMGCFSVG